MITQVNVCTGLKIVFTIINAAKRSLQCHVMFSQLPPPIVFNSICRNIVYKIDVNFTSNLFTA